MTLKHNTIANKKLTDCLPLGFEKHCPMSQKPRVLIPVAIPRKPFDDILPEFELIYPSGDAFSDDEVDHLIHDCVAFVSIFGRKVTQRTIDKAPSLKIIANYGVGYDNVDVDHARRKGIVVTNCPHPVTEPTAELALALMLNVARQVSALDAALKQGRPLTWGTMHNLSSTLTGKQLGIVGMGAIGKAVARRALAFGMTVVYHNRKPIPLADENRYHAQYLSMDELLMTSDVVSLHVPFTSATRHLIDRDALLKMKRSSMLINTARGPVVDEQALVDALINGTIGGAGLDVYENEPHITPALLQLTNVVLTPHTGSATFETREQMSVVVAHNIRALIDGLVPPNVVA